MPRVDDLYPDKFLKAAHIDEMLADTDEEHVLLTVKSTDIAKYSDGKAQITLKFREIDQELGLNKGNAKALAELFDSDDSDHWIGRKVALHSEEVQNSLSPTGRSQAVRVSVKQTAKANRPEANPKQPTKSKKPAPALTQAEADADEDSEIPF